MATIWLIWLIPWLIMFFSSDKEYKWAKVNIKWLPNQRNDLNDRQKEILIKNFPLQWRNKVAVFLFPWIFLLYARKYWWYLLLLIISFIPYLSIIVSLIARIVITIKWESICYSKNAKNMKKCLMCYENKRNKNKPNYDDWEIYGNWGSLWCIIPIIVWWIVWWIFFVGILIAALLPRMWAAQGRARDVARKTALSQIQSAIVNYQGDYGKWPGMDGAKNWISVSNIESELKSAWLTSIPTDPITSQDYMYIASNNRFALIAKTETELGSNRVDCDNNWIKPSTNLANIEPCTTLSQWNVCSNCTYTSTDQLRYVVVY